MKGSAANKNSKKKATAPAGQKSKGADIGDTTRDLAVARSRKGGGKGSRKQHGGETKFPKNSHTIVPKVIAAPKVRTRPRFNQIRDNRHVWKMLREAGK